MKKIITSLGTLAFVAALVAGGTGAFFSDTETSTGNVFTAGAIDLKVDSEQHYNGNICTKTDNVYEWAGEADYPVPGTPCDGTWDAIDLGAQKFFNFSDVKPGDEGENTISLHIDNNPAWACLTIKTTANDENDLIDPEAEAGDATFGPLGNGELAGNIKYQAWIDDGVTPGFQGKGRDDGEGDNIWQVGEAPLASGSLSDITGDGVVLPLADSLNGPAIDPNQTHYVGLYWCAGDITGGAGNLGCDGTNMGNESQTDSATVDVEFEAVQTRHNDNFNCLSRQTQG